MRPRPFLRRLLFLAVAGALQAPDPGPARAQEDDWIGYVARVDGAWRIGGEGVELGRTITEEDTLRVGPARTSSALVVVLKSGRRVRFSCASAADCVGPLVPADSVRGESVVDRASRVVRAVAGVFRSEPERLVSLVSRGKEALSRYEALEREGDRIDVGPLLAGEPKGRYRIELEPLGPGFDVPDRGRGEDPVSRSIVEWDPNAPAGRSAWVDAPVADVCLHHARTSDLSSFQPSTEIAWVHAGAYPDSARVRYEDVRAGIREAIRVAAAWETAPASERDAFVRGYLSYASREWCWTDR